MNIYAMNNSRLWALKTKLKIMALNAKNMKNEKQFATPNLPLKGIKKNKKNPIDVNLW